MGSVQDMQSYVQKKPRGIFPDPIWPSETMSELLELGFGADHLIDAPISRRPHDRPQERRPLPIHAGVDHGAGDFVGQVRRFIGVNDVVVVAGALSFSLMTGVSIR